MDQAKQMQELVNDFANHLLKQQAIMVAGGDVTKGNRHHDVAFTALDDLVYRYSKTGLEALAQLLHHEDPKVRCTTANVLLGDKHEESKAVLEDIASRPDLGLICAGAQATLGRWENGTWTRPFEEEP